MTASPALCLRAALLALMLWPAVPAAARDTVPAHWETVYDFMVQDVCVDAAGAIILAVTPLDGTVRCPLRRNLQAGELLPYRKHDWPREGDRKNPRGYQRSDNIPVRMRLYGTAVIQSRKFLRSGREDGDIYLFSDRSVAIGLTEDGTGGIQFFYGPECLSRSAPARILNSWIVVDRSFSLVEPGSTLARLTKYPLLCLALSNAFTRWNMKTIEFRTSAGPRSLATLVSDHFDGSEAETANHLERFYYTRELGLLRWERWENPGGRLDDENPMVKKAGNLAASKRCDPIAEMPSGKHPWLMIDCRQWTNLVPPDNPGGDSLPGWIGRIRKEPVTKGLFEE